MNSKEILEKISQLLVEYRNAASEEKKEKRHALSELLFDEKEWQASIKTILGGWISQGPNVRAFEKAFSAYCGCEFGIGVNSGSSANLLALLALKNIYHLQDGDEVIIPATTFATVAMPIIQLGFVPVYVDVSLDTYNIEPTEIEKAITAKTKIIMPVHTLGYPADMHTIMDIAKKHNLLVLEDCCEAHGASLGGKKVGSFGDIATFSFFVAHNMTTGEGGMIVTNEKKLEQSCRSLREFGRIDQQNLQGEERFYSDDSLTDYDKRYVFEKLGYNLRMTDISASFGIEQLKKLDRLNEIRRRNAGYLSELIQKNMPEQFFVTKEQVGYFHTYYGFPLLLAPSFPFTRKGLVQFLENNKIETRPLFAGCLPDQPGFKKEPGRVVGNLPNSRYIRDRAFFVGIHPGLTKKQLESFVDSLQSFALVNR